MADRDAYYTEVEHLDAGARRNPHPELKPGDRVVLPPELGSATGRIRWDSDPSWAIVVPFNAYGALVYIHKADVNPIGESWPVDGMAEPPDGTRLEFEWCTDVCAVARDDESSREAGYVVGDGGAVWCVYGEGVPCTWQELIERFSEDALRNAVRLTPVVADLPNRERWPTAVYARTGVWPVDGQSSPTKTAETRRHLMGGEP